jgi:uncharacterized membrane protein
MRYRKIRNAGLLLGIGLGAFLDGIVLHQIAHWHQMLSARVPPETVAAMQRNMAADGWFHLAAWAITLAGVLVLWSAVRGAGRLPATRTLLGYMLAGWGAFNVVEGIVDHHILELHHVRDLPTYIAYYDWAFIVVSAALIVIGLALRDAGDREPAPFTADRRRGRDRRLAW